MRRALPVLPPPPPVGRHAVAERALQVWLFCALSIAQVERSQTRPRVTSVLLSRPHRQAATLHLLVVAMQAIQAMPEYKEEPVKRVRRVRTRRRQAPWHARIVQLSRPLLLAALLCLLAVAMQATEAMQTHLEELAPRVGRVRTRRRRAT